MARRLWSVHRVRNSMINEMTTPGLAKKTRTTPCCEVLPVEKFTARALSEPTRSTAKMSATTMRRRDVVIACDPTGRYAMIGFNTSLRAILTRNLGAHVRREHPIGGRRHAAVVVVIVDSDSERHAEGMIGAPGGAAVLLCQRAFQMTRHAGQYALPGGRVEPGETPTEAGLRELEEELGIRGEPESVVGWLDDYATRSGYLITPLVLWGPADPALTPAEQEVLSVHRLSLQTLVDTEPRFIAIPESDRPVLQLPLGSHLIHAPTGAVLFQLRQVGLLGRSGERVEGFEEPVFAWS
ncbi:MAG: CoA pyrophosphatase [Solirubrobacteraceae bacterium]